MNRRKFLQISLALGAALAGCGSSDQASFSDTTATAPAQPGTKTLFPGYPDPLDLTAPGERPPTEIPNPERFFGPDEPDLKVATQAGNFLDTFDYVVVLMLENRAFDHFCGFLYPDNKTPSGKSFNGANRPPGQGLINQAPDGTNILFSPATDLQTPLIDPAETYGSVNTALWGSFVPASNEQLKKEDYKSPYNIPPNAPTPPPMSGFANSFAWSLRAAGKPDSLENISTIMQGYTPNLIPGFSTLAQQFAICDNWFCGVPSQTYCNRSMFNAGSSSGWVNNSPVIRWPFRNTVKTIGDSLEEEKGSWKIYYDETEFVCGTRLINYPRLIHLAAPVGMTEFYDDVKAGKLPRYSWVQPRLIRSQNSYHPDAGAAGVKRGEILLSDVYQAIKQSNNPNGSNYKNTLLVVTFDEGGTCYDHVPPPAAVPPGDGHKGELDFNFERHGQRIPTLLISPWIAPNTVVSQQLDATSFIRSLEVKFGLDTLNARVAASPTLEGVPFTSTPRDRAQMPTLQIRKLTAAESADDLDEPLEGDEGPGLVKMANALLTGAEDDLPAGVVTVRDALNYLQTHQAELNSITP